MDWAGLNQAALAAEDAQGGHGRRIVRVWHPEADHDIWIGTFGCATIEVGAPAYQFSDGEIVTL